METQTAKIYEIINIREKTVIADFLNPIGFEK